MKMPMLCLMYIVCIDFLQMNFTHMCSNKLPFPLSVGSMPYECGERKAWVSVKNNEKRYRGHYIITKI